jgi:putative membrane protein
MFLNWRTTLKGVAMGAADIVPGISGGTIAFISGIYEPLLDSIYNINFSLFSLYKEKGIKACWDKINGNFLLSLVLGIAFSIISLAKVTHFLLDHYPPLIWSFFFGLIVSSIWTMKSHIKPLRVSGLSFLGIGIFLGYYFSQMSSVNVEPSLLTIFLSGYIAICAMILPGISGSFILLVLGMYNYMIKALITIELQSVSVFLLGCVLGLLSFSRFLRWVLKEYHVITVSLLLGFMVGSLQKVWPWKVAINSPLVAVGKSLSLEKNVLPFVYEKSTGNSSFLFFSICLFFVGGLVVFFLNRLKED